MTNNANTQNRFLRQLDIVSPEKLTFPITVIGAGAIGSAAVVTLAKMGCSNITVWDVDILEDVNIPNQLCKPSLVGRPKVEALAELVYELTDIKIKQVNRRYMGQSLEGVVIVAVDNMTTRQKVWKRAKLNQKIPLLVDARMGAEFARIYAIHPTNVDEVEFYQQNLYGTGETEHLPCSARSIIYCPMVVAGFIALLVKKHAMSQLLQKEILIDLPNLLLQTERR
jgi:molybdopterin/thiamine biosynthesis adenylyltransferase